VTIITILLLQVYLLLMHEDNTIIRDRVAAPLLEDGNRYFWQENKRIRGNKAVSSRMVGGLTYAGDIAHFFTSRCRDLYTSVPYNIHEILNGIDSSLAGMSISKDCIFSVCDVENAVSKLKPHKSKGSSDLATDHCIYGSRYCLSLVAIDLLTIPLLANCVICYQYKLYW